ACRLFSNALFLPHYCARTDCRRRKICRGRAQRCLLLYSGRIPLEVRAFLIDILGARELGYRFEEALARNPAGTEDYLAWVEAHRPEGAAGVAAHRPKGAAVAGDGRGWRAQRHRARTNKNPGASPGF